MAHGIAHCRHPQPSAVRRIDCIQPRCNFVQFTLLGRDSDVFRPLRTHEVFGAFCESDWDHDHAFDPERADLEAHDRGSASPAVLLTPQCPMNGSKRLAVVLPM